jgi:predicted Kef-type K+ transport protein
MSLALILVAFVAAFFAGQIRLPPMVGFLAAGFIMVSFGVEAGDGIQQIANLGITLLLFTIGLKLDIRDLIRPEAFGVTLIHMGVTTVLFGLIMLGAGAIKLSLFATLNWQTALLLAFALSFSSTVFAVTVLEGRGEMGALHGRTAIAMLIFQDIAAVVFIASTSESLPSIWALLLFGLPLLRPVISSILEKSGYGELQVLLGFCLALAGYELFAAVNLKGDLGALAVGLMLAGTPKASDLAKSLLGFKEMFLVFFFLSIGLSGLPTVEAVLIALALIALLPLKTGLYFLLLTRFHLRARTSTLTSLTLSNYSEFGLIAGSAAFASGWLSGEWLVILAITVAISFTISAPINVHAHHLFDRYAGKLRKLETITVLPYDQPIEPGNAEIIVFGMGRLGTAAYQTLEAQYGKVVLGVDRSPDTVTRQVAQGRNVIHGDPSDIDFWERTRGPYNIRVAVLAMPGHGAILTAIDEIRSRDFGCSIAAVASKHDQLIELEEAGASASYNFYAEAGVGLARHVINTLEQNEASASKIRES